MWTRHDDLPAFEALVRPHLEAHEAEHGLLLGLLARAAADPPAGPPFLARLADGDATRAVAYHAGLNVILSRGAGAGAEALAAALLADGRPVPGIVGPAADVEAVAAAWTAASGRTPVATVAQMLYELREVAWPEPVPGRMRPMAEADAERVAGWLMGFHREAVPFEPFSAEAARADAAARPAQGRTYLWEADGAPVAMAALARPTRRTITVNAVYTPPERRRRGYAGALVAALSAEGLRRGHAACVLYTDLANPTSNALYQRLGYRPVAASRNVRF